MKAYLAGAIEYAPDGGKSWRELVEKFLTDKLGHSCYNPVKEEFKIIPPSEYKSFRSLKDKDLDGFRYYMGKIIDRDLRVLTREIDYVVCYWDRYAVKGGGTYGELTIAYHYGIPVYMVSEFEPGEMSSWVIGCTLEIFNSFEALFEFLLQRYNEQA